MVDLYKLNIIRDLRSLDFSMLQIKDYLDKQSLENTLALLNQEQELIDTEIENLKIRRMIIQERIKDLQDSINIEAGLMDIKYFPCRYCVRLNEHITRDEEMDLIIKKLHQKHEDKIRDLGNLTIGAFLSMPSIIQDIANVYDSVFFVLDGEKKDYDFTLPEGKYLTYYYRGSYEQNALRVKEMLTYIKKNQLNSSEEPFELFTIDNRDTMKTEEFLTEIQIYLGGN